MEQEEQAKSTDHTIVIAIQDILSKQEWSARTLDLIADVLIANGYPICDDSIDDNENT